ncbi:Podocin [Orbilia brochopaga]|nr:Podocin [Drechslerella brochopaga]
MSGPKATNFPPAGYNGAHAQAASSARGSDAPLVDVQPPRIEDLQPSYAKMVPLGEDKRENNWYGSMISALGVVIGSCGAIPCCICCPNPYKPVSQGNVGLVTRFGRFSRAEDPGLVRINPLSEKLIMVDVKIQICEVPQQVCMTKDNVTVHLTSVIYYHIVAPHKAAFGISNVRQALIERTQTTLRHVVGARVLQDVIERREEVAQSISEIIEEVASGWGVRVESMLIKDIIFSRELQDSLSMAAQSKRIGESKVIAARAEVESAKLMRQAADILSSNAAMQIRYLEAMQQIAKTAGSKVVFLPGASNGPSVLQGNAFSDPQSGEAGLSADGGLSDAYKANILENM